MLCRDAIFSWKNRNVFLTSIFTIGIIAKQCPRGHACLHNTGESYNGSITVSKTVHGGSNPSSPARKAFFARLFSFMSECYVTVVLVLLSVETMEGMREKNGISAIGA